MGRAPDPDGYEASVRDFMLTFGDAGEKYLAALVATFRGGARHELRRTLEVRERVGEGAFRRALERAAAYGAAGGATIERIAEDLIRRGAVTRRAPDPRTPLLRNTSPEVPIRPLSYYHEILAAEAEATPRSRAEPDTDGGRT